jgi:hypothetical protein
MDFLSHRIARRRAVTSKLSYANPLQSVSRITLPTKRSFSPVGSTSLPRINLRAWARSVWTDPIDAFMHRVLNLHAGPPLLEFGCTRRNAASVPTLGQTI